MNSKIIITGRSCSGKSILAKRFINRGFSLCPSYTTREIRSNEKDGIDYNFITIKQFEDMIKNNDFYEWVKHANNYYGKTKQQFHNYDLFVMEPNGIEKLLKEDREKCLIIFIDINKKIIYERLKQKRKDYNKRFEEDIQKFKSFNNYDLKIANSDF